MADYQSAYECVPGCWTPAPCPVCGRDLPPRGRSLALEATAPQCCMEHRWDASNTRHLWFKDEAPR